MVRSSFSILFFIRENRVRKDGTTIIEVLITVNGERITDLEFIVSKEDALEQTLTIVRRGKKKYYVGTWNE